MRKRFAALLLFGWLVSAGAAWAESPISVSHTMTGYTMGTDSVTLTYNLTVRNTSAGSITNVTLTHVPLFIGTDQIYLNIGILDAQSEVKVPFTITSPILLEQNMITGLPLFWACEGMFANGGPIKFPLTSVQGGVL